MAHDHGGMDSMSGMGGMDMGSVGLFLVENQKIARALWYIVAATVFVRGSLTLVDHLRTRHAKWKHSLRSAVPSRPTNILTQAYETIITSFRELSYPALRPFKGRVIRTFTPPPLGQSLVVLTYWVILLIMLWTNVFLGSTSSLYGYRWEKPAFRAGWVSVTQVPLLFALSCKFNVISIVTGISYERLNWLHRWVSRTLFLTVIVHWAYFFHEWTLADFVKYQLEMMPMVKYGFGAWAVIGWMVLTGFGFFRDLCYELWVLQHLAGAGTLLWLLYVHLPSYARYNVWLSVAFIVLDRGARGVWVLVNNLHLRRIRKRGLGFEGEATAVSDGYLRLKVRDVDFNWSAGQHVFLSIPACGIFESHPFTIANKRFGPAAGGTTGDETGSCDLDIFLKCHSGFTRRLQRRAQQQRVEDGTSLRTHRVFLSGPWGTPPLSVVERSNTLVFISSSTGASYTMPILEHAIKNAPFVQRICFYWVVRHASQISWHDIRLRAAMRQLASLSLDHIEFKIFITGLHTNSELEKINLPADTRPETTLCALRSLGLPFDSSQHGIPQLDATVNFRTSSKDISSNSSIDEKHEHGHKPETEKKIVLQAHSISSSLTSASSDHGCGVEHCKSKSTLTSPSFTYALGRPHSFEPLIRPTVEAALGETVIIACGGKDMMAQARTYVAGLSDERAVHKGSGAQGIYLWTESYGW